MNRPGWCVECMAECCRRPAGASMAGGARPRRRDVGDAPTVIERPGPAMPRIPPRSVPRVLLFLMLVMVFPFAHRGRLLAVLFLVRRRELLLDFGMAHEALRVGEVVLLAPVALL